LQPLSPTHRGYLPGAWFYADILGDGVIVTAMTRLVDGDQREQRGLAFAAAPSSDDPAPDLAFEWRLWLDPNTRGWLTLDPESTTLTGVRLDIVPVRLQRPLYKPMPIVEPTQPPK
jgi:cyanophycinase